MPHFLVATQCDAAACRRRLFDQVKSSVQVFDQETGRRPTVATPPGLRDFELHGDSWCVDDPEPSASRHTRLPGGAVLTELGSKTLDG